MNIPRNIANCIDQAYLKVDEATNVAQLRLVCEEVLKYQFRSLCIPPLLVATVSKHYPDISISVVIGYPLGLDTTASKIFSIQESLEYEVTEFDIVLDLFAIKAKAERKLNDDLQRLISATGGKAKSIKAIIEAPILTPEEITWVCNLCADYELGYVKTSTGYNRPPSTIKQVQLMRKVVGSRCGVKAAGGIRTYSDTISFIEAGADIIGTSNGVAILTEALV